MRGLRSLLRSTFVAVFLALPLALVQPAHAQVSVAIGIGPVYVYPAPTEVGVPPVCRWGYYSYYSYTCRPYGYYGSDWFYDGVFIGAGPWYRGRYGHPWGWASRIGYRGWYGHRYWRGVGWFSHRGYYRGRYGSHTRYYGRSEANVYFGGHPHDFRMQGGYRSRAGNGFRGSFNGGFARGGREFHGGGQRRRR